MLGVGIKKLVQGDKDATGLLLSGGMFCGIPTAMIFGFRATQKKVAVAEQKQRTDPAPWRRRGDWVQGEIVGTENKPALALFVGAVVGLAMLLFFAMTFIGTKAFAPTMLIFLIPVGASALFLAVLGVRARSRQRKFGRSVFKMASVPGVIGGKLEGKIEVGARLKPVDGFKLKLQCLNVVSSGKNARVRTLWQDERLVRFDTAADDPSHSAIPVSFDIPADGDESDDSDPSNRVVWRLEARASVPGVNYLSRFEVPVFQKRPVALTQTP